MAANSPKVLAERGVMMQMQNPPRLVVFCRTYVNPTTGVRVTFNPLANMGMKAYLQEAYYGVAGRADVDKVLVEDGYLPLAPTNPQAKRQELLRKMMPFFAIRPVLSKYNELAKYDGCVQRDPVESKMSYQSVSDNMNPPVDPRARRAIERILTYPNNTSVVVPWSTQHMPYFYHNMPLQGFELQKNEELLVVDRTTMFIFTLVPMMFFLWTFLLFVKLLFGL